jgi:glycosyltransferase involved in cell wall biosynthesis
VKEWSTTAWARSLLLVRNGVEHDARVLRAARVAERTLGGRALIVGVATAEAPAGETTVEGVAVKRLSTQLIGVRARTSCAQSPPQRVPSDPPLAASDNLIARPNGRAYLGPRARAGPHLRHRARAGPHLRHRARAGPHLNLRARVGRILAGLAYGWQALRLARRLRPQLVHANDWNTMWCALAIKLTCGARVIYDSHELWPDRNGRWEWRAWLLASEALFVRVADVVITASPGYADVLAQRYRIARPLVIRNIPEDLPSPSRPLADYHSPNGLHSARPPLVVYVGGLMPGRGLEQTIDALALTADVRLRAIGPGPSSYRAVLQARADAAGVGDRLELLPPVPPDALVGALADAAAGLCLIQPVCRSYELTLPNKLFEYAAAAVPVLASDLPVIAAVVRGAKLGEVVKPDDPAAIANGLARLLEPQRHTEATRNAVAFATANDWHTEARRLARVYV